MEPGLLEAPCHLFDSCEAYIDATPVIAVDRFGHDGKAKRSGSFDSFFLAGDDHAAGNGEPGLVQQRLRQLLVAGDLGRDLGSMARTTCPYSLYVFAVAKLHKAAAVHPPPGDATRLGLPHQRGSGGAESAFLAQGAQVCDGFCEIEMVERRRGDQFGAC